MFIVGIDIAKRSHEGVVIDEDGNTVRKPFSFKNSCAGYNFLLEQIRKLTIEKSQLVFAMEATAHYWLALYARLTKDGYTVIVINPIQSHALREMYIRKTKTDEKDCLVIADLIRFKRYRASNVPQDKLLGLRELCRSRSYLMDSASDFKRKLTVLLDKIFPEYETMFDSIFCKTSIAVLHKYPTPQKMKNAHLDKLTELLWETSNGRFGEWKARQLKEAARNSFGIEDCDGVYSTVIESFLKQIESLTAEADGLEKQIAARFKEFDSQLMSIPGIGSVLSATILSEIGDISRFPSVDKLLGYAGLDPSVKQSGQFKSDRNCMSKRGSPYLRRAIWEASTTAVQCDPMFRDYYEKKRSEGLTPMNAIGHVTRKMTAVIFAVLRDDRAYQPVLQNAV
jgi:transposase